jgi:peptidoglycan-associated lipoprotein
MTKRQRGIRPSLVPGFAREHTLLIALCSALLVAVAGCHKKKVPPPPPPPPAEAPPASKPVVDYFTAEPATISSGQPSSLRWSVTGATSADATITVASPPPPAPAPVSTASSIQDILAHQVQDIHFDYDKSDIRPADQSILQGDAAALKQIFALDSNFIVTVEGHCDERGSAEYNLALGDRRAGATRDALAALGVPPDKVKTISYGKERPLCTDATEGCYARNRRAHFSASQ